VTLPDFPPGVLYAPTGSRVICDPPEGSDYDVLVYVADPWWAPGGGWSVCTGIDSPTRPAELGYPTDFRSYRRGEVNLIVTSDPDFYDRFLAATHVAKRLNLKKKPDRVALFQAVLYANCWTEPEPE